MDTPAMSSPSSGVTLPSQGSFLGQDAAGFAERVPQPDSAAAAARKSMARDLSGIPRVTDATGEKVREAFQTFLSTYSKDGGRSRYYLRQIELLKEFELKTVYIDFSHLQSVEDGVLADAISQQYYRFLPFLTKALLNLVKKHAPSLYYTPSIYNIIESQTDSTAPSESDSMTTAKESGQVFQLAFYGMPVIDKIRDLKTDKIGSLLSISGTVTRTSEVRPELYRGSFTCDGCRTLVTGVDQVFKYTEPYMCPNPTCQNRSSWTLVASKSQFVNWQRLRVQENSSEIPTGSMPRTLDVILRGDQVENAKAGDKCIFTGCEVAVPDVSKLGLPGVKPQAFRDNRSTGRGEGMDGAIRGLKALGVKELSYSIAFLGCMVQDASAKVTSKPQDLEGLSEQQEQDLFVQSLTAEEVAELKTMINSETLFRDLVQSIAPAIHGHDMIKKGILLQLLGGVHKTTKEGISLRGDVNVCIVGDPSTSKSQFLKYVCGFMPRAVYTSGKASSAAGLTAAVVKDEESGEFTIEAGALMLADNGVCAIDEFDKMDIRDQVAIHEAMEQQTISIAKAGIHATLNARTAILAAANPRGGRYNRKAPLKYNIDMSAPIMSRFDLFFVVLDECNSQTDTRIASHIVDLHMNRDAAITPPYSTAQLQRYIQYARTFKPRLNVEAQAVLVEYYKQLRKEDAPITGQRSYRITVRQLESLVRLSEAVARAHSADEVVPEFVREAYNLLRQSTISVDMEDIEVDDESMASLSNANVTRSKAHDTLERAGASETGGDRMAISRDQYNDVVRVMLQRLASAQGQPVSHGDLVTFYLHEVESSISSISQFEHETTLANKILRHMVRQSVLLEIRTEDMSDDELESGEQVDPVQQIKYVIHPNAATSVDV